MSAASSNDGKSGKPSRTPKQCEVCKRPLRNVRRKGRKRRYCSDRCRSTARRTRNFVSSGYTSSRAAQNGENNAVFSRPFKVENGDRPISKPRGLTRELREAII